MLTIRPATASRWKDIATLFGSRGACAGCWCMYWRVPRARYEQGKGAVNRRAFRRLVSSDAEPGLIAYVDGVPAAWCALAPREDYPGLSRSRILAPVDDHPVWSISCFFVAKPHRRQGLTVNLLREAARFAQQRGGRILEGYPLEPTKGAIPDAFAWTGLSNAFVKAGFSEVARRSAGRPIMRRTLNGRG